MKRNKKQLPENVSVPEDSILSEETYEHIFALISNQSNYMKLKELYEESQSLNGVWDESKYQALIDAGLAARKTGAGNPYIEITSIGETLVKLAEQNKKIVAITAAMPQGTGLVSFKNKFPKRFFDVGIAEDFAVTFSAGLAIGGKKPFVSIYSTIPVSIFF